MLWWEGEIEEKEGTEGLGSRTDETSCKCGSAVALGTEGLVVSPQTQLAA